MSYYDLPLLALISATTHAASLSEDSIYAIQARHYPQTKEREQPKNFLEERQQTQANTSGQQAARQRFTTRPGG